MGLLRGFARWTVKILLALSIAFFLVASTGAHFSEKENFKPILGDIAVQQVPQQQITEAYNGLNLMCKQQKTEIIDAPFQNSTIKVNCTRLGERKEEEVKDILRTEVTDKMLESLTKPCSGLDCLNQGPVGILSTSFHQVLAKIEIYSIIAIVIFAVLLFLLSTGISGRMFAVGMPFLIAGIPYFFINSIKKQAVSSIPPESATIGAKVADGVLNYMADKFFMMFFAGFILIVAFIITRFVFRKK